MLLPIGLMADSMAVHCHSEKVPGLACLCSRKSFGCS